MCFPHCQSLSYLICPCLTDCQILLLSYVSCMCRISPWTNRHHVVLLALLSHCTFLHVNSCHVKQPLITMLHSWSDCKTIPFLASFSCTSFYNMIRIKRNQIISGILFKDFSFLLGQQLLSSRFHCFLFRRQ